MNLGHSRYPSEEVVEFSWAKFGGFYKIEKVTKFKAERGTSSWRQTSNSTPARQLLLERSVELGLGEWDEQR